MDETKNKSSGNNSKRSVPGIVSDYKYIPGNDRPKSEAAENKRPSSGNIKGV